MQVFVAKPNSARQTVHVPTAVGHLLQLATVQEGVQLVLEFLVNPLLQVSHTSTFESHSAQLRIEHF